MENSKQLPPGTDKELVSFAEYVLEKDDELRCSSRDAMDHPFFARVKQNREQQTIQCVSSWVNKTLQVSRCFVFICLDADRSMFMYVDRWIDVV